MARTVAGPASSEGMRNVVTAIHPCQGGLEPAFVSKSGSFDAM